jgi:hypothetical protein
MAVDVALIDTDGEHIAQLGATACRPYSKAERALLRRATAAGCPAQTGHPHLILRCCCWQPLLRRRFLERILHRRECFELDRPRLAIHLLHFADVNVLHDVARARID